MNYIFFGSPRFAKIFLEQLLLNNFIPKAVVVNQDKIKNNKKNPSPCEVKILIEEFNKKNSKKIDILQPLKLDVDFLNTLKNYQVDFFLVAAYSKILKKDLINIPISKTLGIHPSLLPIYRGASPIQYTLLNGDNFSGTTLFEINEGIDSGNIISQEKISINEKDTYTGTEEKLALLSAKVFIKNIHNYLEQKNSTPQKDTEATYTKKIITEEAEINFNDLKKALNGELKKEDLEKIQNKIRALEIEPTCFCITPQNIRFKIHSSEIINSKLVLKKITISGKSPKDNPDKNTLKFLDLI